MCVSPHVYDLYDDDHHIDHEYNHDTEAPLLAKDPSETYKKVLKHQSDPPIKLQIASGLGDLNTKTPPKEALGHEVEDWGGGAYHHQINGQHFLGEM